MRRTRTVRSVCPHDCPDACGLLVEVDEGRVVGVAGDPQHPFTRGLLCPKVRHYERTVHSPRRLTTPLIRTGPKGSGAFRRASWGEAIERIVERWGAILPRYGAEAILPYSYGGTMGIVQRSAGHPFFHKLGASRLDRTICSPAKEAAWEAVLGETPAPHPDTAAESDLIILWGINAAATNLHFLHPVRRAKQKGAKVWLIDTYRTQSASVADRVFLVRPGSDGALALGLMHLLAREGLVDEPFVARHVQGYEELRERVLPHFAPPRVSALTGLPESTLEEMARAFGAARAPFVRIGGGLSRYGNGSMTVRCIVALPALVGAYGRKGAGCLSGTRTSVAFALHEVTREDLLPRPTRIVNMNRLGDALNALDDPPVMGLYVYHANPAASAPDQNAVLRGLARDDLFTVVHERFLTDTARWADIVLPATSALEQGDLYRAYGGYCIQRARPAIPPVGESRSNWETFSLLADALGFRDEIFSRTTQEMIERLLASPSPLLKGVDRSRLDAGYAVELSLPQGDPLSFATPSGKVEIFNPREEEPLLRHFPPHSEGEGLPLRLMTAPSPYGLNSSFNERDELRTRQGAMRLLLSPADSRERGVAEGERVTAFNALGEVEFFLSVSDRVPEGIAVAEGVWWSEFAPGERTVNALTSQRLTDSAGGSTFYDNRIDVRKASG